MGLSQRLQVLFANAKSLTTHPTRTKNPTCTNKRHISHTTSSSKSTQTSSLYLDTKNDSDDHKLHSFSTTTVRTQETIVIAVVGKNHIGISRLIHCGFPSTIAQHDMKNTSGTNINIQQHSVMLNLNNNTSLRHIQVLGIGQDIENHDLSTTSVHAAIICYDVTQSQSMVGVPDLLDYYHTRRLPVFLLGVQSDLTAARQLDFALGEQLAHQHSVPFYKMVMDNTQNIQHVFLRLIQQCVNSLHNSATITTNTGDNSKDNKSNYNTHTCTISPPESLSSCSSIGSTTAEAGKTSNNVKNTENIVGATKEAVGFQHPVETSNDHYLNDHLHHHHRATMTTTSSHPTNNLITTFGSKLPIPPNGYRPALGFAYVPTPTTSPYGSQQVRHENPPSESLFSFGKISTDNFTDHQRGYKDSSESYGNGLTVDVIIDRLVSPEIGRCDEHMIPIFIIFFRKFMTPCELIQALTKRFEDHMCMPVLPTPQQQRIASILITWMTDYWSDFYHQQVREKLGDFLGRLAMTAKPSTKFSTSPVLQSMPLQHILDLLYHLSMQPVPDHDPDSFWAKKDSNNATTSVNSIHYTSSSQLSIQQRPLSPVQNSLLPSTSVSLRNFSIASEAPSCSTTATLSSLSHPRPNLTKTPVYIEDYRHHIAFRSNQSARTISTRRQKTPIKATIVHPSPTRMTRPEFSGGTIRFNYSHLKLLTLSQPASTKNLEESRQLICQRHQQVTKQSTPFSCLSFSSPSSSSSSLSIPSSRSLTSNTSRAPTPPPFSPPSPLSLRTLPSRLTRSPTTNKLLNQNHQNNSKYDFLYKWLLSATTHTQRPVSSSSSICTDVRIPSSANNTRLSIKYNTNFLLCVSEHDMANQLTWIEAELFGKVKSREFVRIIWSNHDIRPVQQPQTDFIESFPLQEETDRQLGKNDPMGAKSGLLASISHFNFISAWVISMVVTQPKLAKRVALLEKFMMIAVVLRDFNNYNTLMAILAGINNAAILRLKQTQGGIKKKKIYKRFRSLEKLMGSDRSYCSYRLALRASTTCPSIPYLGIHSQDLIALAEANKDVKSDGTIHWEKFRLMGDCIMVIMNLQQPKHKVVSDQMILTWLADFCILTEEEQYQQSMQIEPRVKTSSLNHLRDLWLKT